MDNDYRIISRSPAAVWVYPRMIDHRIDAHPFQPYLVEIDELLAKRSDCVTMEQKMRRRHGMSGGATPRGANYLSEGIRFIRTEDVTPNWIDLSHVVHISTEDHKKLKRSALEEDDVLLTITGALFGQAATVYSECLPANISQHSVRVHFNTDVDPRYVSTYLNCRYGQAQIQKQRVGATRSAIDYTGVKALKMPLPPRPVQEYIGAKVRLAERCRARAKELRQEAWHRLATGVGIDVKEATQILEGKHFRVLAIQPETASVDPMLVSARLDPAAYSPVRLGLLDLFEYARCEFRTIEVVAEDVTKRRRRFVRDKYGASYFISILHLNNKGVVDLKEAEAHFPVSLGIVCQAGDVLFSGINPRQNRVAVWSEEGRALCSAEFTIYQARKGFSPFYLAFVWRSVYCLNQLEALTRGTSSSRRRLKEEDFAELLVPVLSSDDQALIARNEQQAVSLNVRAAGLVREAKADVEALIEGQLDVEGIVAGRVQSPTWEEVEV